MPDNQVCISRTCGPHEGSIKSGFIALHGEAGFQPEILRGGYPFLLSFHLSHPQVRSRHVGQGKIAYVFARDGAPLAPSQVLAGNDIPSDRIPGRAPIPVEWRAERAAAQNPARGHLRDQYHAIRDITDVHSTAIRSKEQPSLDDMRQVRARRLRARRDRRRRRRIVTVHDGPSLPPGEIIAPDRQPSATPRPSTTISRSRKSSCGRWPSRPQLQVLVEGTCFINRCSPPSRWSPKTIIAIGYVGVVVFYIGHADRRRVGPRYRHGERRIGRGVWQDPLFPANTRSTPRRQDRDHPHGQLHPEMDHRRDRCA